MANATVQVVAATASPSVTRPLQLRQFAFFDVYPVKDVHDLASSPEIFKNASEISTVASSSAGLLVADIHGSLHILNKEFVSTTSWVAHVGGRVMHMAERNGVLVTIGEESAVRGSLLKIWDIGKTDGRNQAPVLLKSSKVQPSNKPHPVSCFALSSALSFLAIGLADGTVLLYRHLDQSLSSATSLTALPKTRTIHESSPEPITGLGFRELPNSTNADAKDNNLHLFIVTTNSVYLYHVSGKGSGGSSVLLDDIGCGLGCAVMDWRAEKIVLARDEAVYAYGLQGREPPYAYEGYKSSIHTHLNYVIVVSPPTTATSTSSATRKLAAQPAGGDGDASRVTVFDMENKVVGYTGVFAEGIREVISEWGNIYILTNNGQLTRLAEKSTSAKLSMLYAKALYPLALSLAQTQHLDESYVADIHRQHGDHLYTKGDWDGAMTCYLKTIGWVKPSYVVRKFLDAQRIHNLVTYLQELHALGLANADHTTLLLNTYTKLKDVARLDSFIKTESRRSGAAESNGDLPFDLDTAIRVCRQAGYFDHASYLAKRYKRHEEYLRVMIEDAGKYGEALTYLRHLGAAAAESNLARYGRAMLDNLPEETTQLLIDLCTVSGPLVIPEAEDTTPQQPNTPANTPSYLSYLALSRTPAPEDKVEDSKADEEEDLTQPQTTQPGVPTPSKDKRPSPTLYFAHFVDHPSYFVRFLESVAARRWGQSISSLPSSLLNTSSDKDEDSEKRNQEAVWNTLLELYLDGGSPEQQDKALKVLTTDSLPCDKTHALILCSSYSYTPGLIILWEKLGMYEDILRFWMDKHSASPSESSASTEVVQALERYGPTHSHLYELVLRFLTSTPELLTRHQVDVEKILEHIEKERIIPPLEMGVASVGLVKNWLMGRIKEAREEVQTDQQLINSYRLETDAKLKQVAELEDPMHAKVFSVTRCSQCSGQLDLPSVHFMCNHSYHQRCLLDHETECPLCVRQHGIIQEIRRNNERMADQHELFLADVQDNGFKVVASGFGKGVLNMTRLDDVAV
ncbi:uncharacterized protein EDB93DRAFT_1241828 [Suillus bovinus]|uniref:uncharacterized protein n=1 Tax=Suillus bovinus TaxID=48563 RepID=UPI001B86F7CB|nr:uncharacterized protein EDB93DRAFT_1241828 [Suillus bovinus]KAG2140932.1 hypothetical protein EDB93DRAFT_1241828 [Suillus bovinus]